MLKNILKLLSFFIFGIFGGIFGSQILWPYFIERPLFFKYRLEQNPIYITEIREIKIQENTALQEAFEKTQKAVLGIKTKTKKGKILEGSSLIVTGDGLLITLDDLVPENSSSTIFLENEVISTQVLKRDKKINLALLKIEKTNLPTVGFGDFERMRFGQRVFLVGVVFEDNTPKKITNEGILKYFDQNLIETNIFEKDSLNGSTLFDIEGNVLGLNLINEEGVVFSISISKIKSFLGF
ncbi:hypothetical protein AMJ49_00940 [Parcubacteria bacterium DG_74_2]|nr:MAG: hypothetical protein AMJ49_00940 [Parcubacteria bacterium DG_74_2]